MKYDHLSIDLETLGITPGSVITQIGLSAFNGRNPIICDLIHINPQSCLDLGMTVAWSTISWWLQQSDNARTRMATSPGRSLPDALDLLDKFCADNMGENFCVWGNGATFDIGLLDAAYNLLDRRVPWGFRGVRDMRTLGALVPYIDRRTPVVEHDAREDAIAQGEFIADCLVEINRLRAAG